MPTWPVHGRPDNPGNRVRNRALCAVLTLLVGVMIAPRLDAQRSRVYESEVDPPTAGFVSKTHALVAMDSVFRWIERRHATPYRHRSRTRVLQERTALARSMPDSVDRWWFVDRLAHLVASLDIESIWVFNSSTVQAVPPRTEFTRPAYFPGDIEWVEDRPIVTAGRRGLWVGDEVLRINGVAVDSLIRHSAQAYSGTSSRRLHFATMLITNELARRGLLTAPFHVDVRRWNGALVSLELEPSTLSELAHNAEQRQGDIEFMGVTYYLRSLPNGALVTDIGGLMNDSARAPEFFRRTAERLVERHAPALVVDLRWQSNLPPWLVRRTVNAMRPAGVWGRTKVPICVLMGAMTTDGAAGLVAAIQRQQLARTLGEDAGTRRGALNADHLVAIPHLAANLMLPERSRRVEPQFRVTLHPVTHVPVWRSDVALGRDLAMEVASRCGAL